MFVSKVVQIKGNLSQKNIKYQLCPSTEFATGFWNVTILSICCETNAEVEIDTFCSVSTNFCVAQRFSNQGIVEAFEEPLATFHLKLNSVVKKQFINISPIWLQINRYSNVLHVNFHSAGTSDLIIYDCNVIVTLSFLKQ